MIAVNVTHGIKPVEVEGKTYALKKGDSAFIPSKLAGAMIKRGWAAKIPKPERLGEIEGAEVRDVSRWVKGISGEQINRLKIRKNGLAISFLDVMNVIAGKVYTPFSSSANNEQKESGFASLRVANIFSTFKKGEEARLWWKGGDNPALYIKESVGNLSWRHKLPRLEEAVKMPNLKKIPVAAIKIDINDITLVTTINKGKRVAEKYDFVAFCYSCKNVTVYAIHEEMYSTEKTIVKLNELEAIEGEGEGIAIYRLEHIQKLLKGAKKGIIRIEEDVPLKVSVGIGRGSKAVAFLTPVKCEDLRAQIAEVAGIRHNEETEEDNNAVEEAIEKEAEKVREELEEEEINGTAALDYKDCTIIKEGIVENSQAANYRSGVKLEQNGSFFRIIVKGCYPRGYTTKEEAVKRYEELTEVK
jgi:hypothetical protein